MQKQMVNRPDFSKTDESVFGVVEFQGTKRANQRVSQLQAFLLNTIYCFYDVFPKIMWINLNPAKQILSKDRINSAEGAINMGPQSKSQILSNFRQYSEYMDSSIFTFKTSYSNSNQGMVVFG